MSVPNRYILPVIVLSQFCCTSLWFAGNGVMDQLVAFFSLNANSLGHLTSAVQLGFISGTLLFAVLTIADRFPPSKVFCISALLGALFNGLISLEENNLTSLLILRFFTGFFLAGIYPVGMKIASDYFNEGLGKSLGYLVGALVVGTAFPHFLNGYIESTSWKAVLIITSCLAIFGGLLMLLLKNGPFRKASQNLDFSALIRVFRNKNFRPAAIGYFGHMWELYAFWAFTPIAIFSYSKQHMIALGNEALWSFSIISIGGFACIISGYISQLYGTKKTAFVALFLSGICCLLSPVAFLLNTPWLFLTFFLFWGMVVVADSPLFSTLVASHAEPETKGTALTIVNCIGFSITIISIQLLVFLQEYIPINYLFILLAFGPIIGLTALYSQRHKAT